MVRRWLLCIALIGGAPAAADERMPQVASGRIERLQIASSEVPSRNVDVWLPAGYPEHAPYAVLYMHDGQMLFDAQRSWNAQEWRVDETLGSLLAERALRPTIVVGIWNGGERRHAEYFPQAAFDTLPAELREAGAQAGVPEAVTSDAYLRFLVDELIPAIEARYAVAAERDQRVIAGSSMGGLISLYALAEYPQVFGGAACLSTHWPGVRPDSDASAAVADALIGYLERRLPNAGEHRLWFDHGTATLDAHYPPLQARVDAVLRAKGYGAADWRTLVDHGAAHDEQAWANRLQLPLRFLLAPRD